MCLYLTNLGTKYEIFFGVIGRFSFFIKVTKVFWATVHKWKTFSLLFTCICTIISTNRWISTQFTTTASSIVISGWTWIYKFSLRKTPCLGFISINIKDNSSYIFFYFHLPDIACEYIILIKHNNTIECCIAFVLLYYIVVLSSSPKID